MPSSGRKGDRRGVLKNELSEFLGFPVAVEGARGALNLDWRYCYAFSLTRLRRELPPGGSLSHDQHLVMSSCLCSDVFRSGSLILSFCPKTEFKKYNLQKN